MSGSLVLANVRLPSDPSRPTDVCISDGRIAARPATGAEVVDGEGGLLLPGFVDSHIHLDKAGILCRCQLHDGTLAEAIHATAAAKRGFDEIDIYRRGAAVLERAISHGTTHMRVHVELDPGIGLRGYQAIKRLKRDYAWGIDLQLCVFPQEGLLNNPGTEELLRAALEDGADLLGGCPYTDSDPEGQIERLFAMAREYDVDLDFHLDFDLDPADMTLPAVIRATRANGWGGRVAVGHVTKLSMLGRERLEAVAAELAGAGVALTALPATDLYLMGREYDRAVPRGVAPVHRLHAAGVRCALATNNIANPFTPFGDAQLLRMANLYANVGQLASDTDMEACLSWITASAARLMRLDDYGCAIGDRADLVVVDAESPADAVRSIAPVRLAFKNGRLSMRRPAAQLRYPPGFGCGGH